jgi:hypothetical protein
LGFADAAFVRLVALSMKRPSARLRASTDCSLVKILFSASHLGFLRNFESALRVLAARGHRLHLIADRSECLGGMKTIETFSQRRA